MSSSNDELVECGAYAWFKSLPSVEERAAAMAITDSAFIKVLLGLLSLSMTDLQVTEMSLEELTTLIGKYNRTTALSNKDLLTYLEEKLDKNRASISLKNSATTEDHLSNDIFADREGKIDLSINRATNGNDETEMPNIPICRTSKDFINQTATHSEIENDRSEGELSQLLNTLLLHVLIMFPASFSNDALEIEQMLRNLVKGEESDSKRFEFSEIWSESDKDEVVAITVEPLILRCQAADNLLYLLFNMVDKLLSEEVGCGKDNAEHSDHNGRFLSGTFSLSVGEIAHHWPNWMRIFSEVSKKRGKISVGIMLLSGFELSIEASYQRWRSQKLKEKDQISTVRIQDMSLEHTENTALLSLRPHESCFRSPDRVIKLTEDVEKLLHIFHEFTFNKEKVQSLISPDDLVSVEKYFISHGNIQPEYFLAVPIQWFVSSTYTSGFNRIWNESISCVLSNMNSKARCTKYHEKTSASIVCSTSKTHPSTDAKDLKKQHCIQSFAAEDVESVISAKSSPAKKHKQKKKKKRKSSKSDTKIPFTSVSSIPSGSDILPDAKKELEPRVPNINDLAGNHAFTDHSVSSTGISKEYNSYVIAVKNTDSSEIENEAICRVDSSQTVNTFHDVKSSFLTLIDVPESVSIISHSDTKVGSENVSDDVNESAWETVASKARGRKQKQPSDLTNNHASVQIRPPDLARNDAGGISTSEGGICNNSRKNKRRKDRDKDKKRAAAKAIKDIKPQVLDAISDEVSRRSKLGIKSSDKRFSSSGNRTTFNNDQRRKASAVLPQSTCKHGKSLRDVVVGTVAPTALPPKTAAMTQIVSLDKAKPNVELKGSKIKPGLSYRSVIEPIDQSTGVNVACLHDSETLDDKMNQILDNHNCKSTEKPMLTANVNVSSNSLPSENNSSSHVREIRESSFEDDGCPNPVTNVDDDVNSPPLSTLLGPGTSCSASSSVASSLEAPHSSRFRHQSISTTEEDVGVHLLNVCDQLSEEINTFMSRRSQALFVRRRERSAVLSALQDTLGKIWPNSCHVEMYGSCATQLDLPSSDLDLVVCGLHDLVTNSLPLEQTNCNIQQSQTTRSPNFSQTQSNIAISSQHPNLPGNIVDSLQQNNPSNATLSDQASHEEFDSTYGGLIRDHVVDGLAEYDSRLIYDSSDQAVNIGFENFNQIYHTTYRDMYYVPHCYLPPMSLNAQRVLRLASELEMQPWAVQVKAIPTAAVPVVKMLADPSRLPGGTRSGGRWMVHQQIANQSSPCSQPTSQDQLPVSSSHFFSPPSIPSWRGADLMNGLQPVDITFEGPEHGGVGSTTYSACVVQEACHEAGLPPESTPVVQVAMVLKELLAQRRLNEPFSGGLSSYALLLLLLAVIRDRRIMKEEIERLERLRCEVSQLDTQDSKLLRTSNRFLLPQKSSVNSFQLTSNKITSEEMSSVLKLASNNDINAAVKIAVPSKTPKQIATSSWASIAKKSNGSTARTDSISTETVSNCSALAATNKQSGAIDQAPLTAAREKTLSTKSPIAPTIAINDVVNGGTDTTFTGITINPSLPQRKSTANDESDLMQTTHPEQNCCKLSSPLVQQVSNDVFEVLCSGELTSGKLLMHFLLFYGQHFDAQTTLIDINGTHHPDYGRVNTEKLSPFLTRPPGGTVDPTTGMYSVDPIVVYDPLEGALDHNVSKRCYCWNNVRWVFAQCYMTVSSVVETSGTCTRSTTKASYHGGSNVGNDLRADKNSSSAVSMIEPSCTLGNIGTPILELLLSF